MNDTIHIHICPIKEFYLWVEQMEDYQRVAAVLCTTNDIEYYKLTGLQYLHVSFADITDEARLDAFRPEQATRIRDFVDNLLDGTDLYLCCDSGESRSAALASALMHYLGQDEMVVWKNIKYHPNQLTYYIQSIACGLSITREDAQELAEYNRALFHKAISRQRNG